MSNELTTMNPASLLALAVESGADVDKLEKLMALQERWQKTQAEKAFREAMGRFQADVPAIKRDKEVSFGKTSYKHATLDCIIETIKQPLSENGLSYRYEITGESIITVSFILSHLDGHTETTSMSAEADSSGNKNQIQQRGSTVTYLQRYCMVAGLGLVTADEDNDGQDNSELIIEKLMTHNAMVRENIESIQAIKTGIATQDYGAAIEAWDELSEDEKRGLWIAPSRGGVFTTQERDVMKSNEWSAAAREIHGNAA